MFSSTRSTVIVISIQPWQNTYLLHILEGEENQLKFLLTKMKENEGMEKLTLQFSDISENTISQSLKIFQCKTFQAHGKVIVQIYRPCINIKVFTSFSKDFSQTACWLVLTILVIIFLYSCFHCIYSIQRTAVPTNTLVNCRRSSASYQSAPSPSCQRRVMLAMSPQALLSASFTLTPHRCPM